MDPWPNWIRREATDFEIIGSTPIGFTKNISEIFPAKSTFILAKTQR